jgi:hypothetical protein
LAIEQLFGKATRVAIFSATARERVIEAARLAIIERPDTAA